MIFLVLRTSGTTDRFPTYSDVYTEDIVWVMNEMGKSTTKVFALPEMKEVQYISIDHIIRYKG